MSENVIYNKVKLCYTEVSDFTNFQGVGSDPMYKRYDSVQAVLRTCISDPYKAFLAQPLYVADEDIIEWYVEKWEDFPTRLVDLTGEEREHYKKILDDTVRHYRGAALKLENEDLIILGGAMKYVSEEMVFCYDNKVVLVGWGMRYDSDKHKDFGSLMHAIPTKPVEPVFYQVVFHPGMGGNLVGTGTVNLLAGSKITADMVPAIQPYEDFVFTEWNQNPADFVVNGDTVFTAQYKHVGKTIIPPPEPPKPPVTYNVRFVAGDYGELKGTSQYTVPEGTVITDRMIPLVNAKKRRKFTGWDTEPKDYKVTGDKVFTACYEKKESWWAKIWPWLWKILLALLALLLLLLLLYLFTRLFKGCTLPHHNHHDSEQIDETPELMNGDVEITLHWDNYNDLDLHCKDPNGEELYYDHKRSRSGGILQVDMNNEEYSNHPVEHIYWPTGGAPYGTYQVFVVFYSQADENINDTPYTLRVKYGDKEETFSGSVSVTNDKSRNYTFTLSREM